MARAIFVSLVAAHGLAASLNGNYSNDWTSSTLLNHQQTSRGRAQRKIACCGEYTRARIATSTTVQTGTV
jgi:hypothetical protein